MKTSSLVYTAIVAIAAGVALIFAHKSINSFGVVVVGGIIFIVAGILNLFIGYSEKKNNQKGALSSTFSLLTNIGAMVLGICMVIFQSTFVVLVPYIFGIIVAILAIYQFFVLAVGVRPASLPAWLYIVPVALVGAAIYIFLSHAQRDDHLIMLVTGIALAFFGLFSIIEASLVPHYRKKNQTPAQAETAAPKPLDE